MEMTGKSLRPPSVHKCRTLLKSLFDQIDYLEKELLHRNNGNPLLVGNQKTSNSSISDNTVKNSFIDLNVKKSK